MARFPGFSGFSRKNRITSIVFKKNSWFWSLGKARHGCSYNCMHPAVTASAGHAARASELGRKSGKIPENNRNSWTTKTTGYTTRINLSDWDSDFPVINIPGENPGQLQKVLLATSFVFFSYRNHFSAFSLPRSSYLNKTLDNHSCTLCCNVRNRLTFCLFSKT